MALPVALEQLIGVERLALLREVALVPRDLAPGRARSAAGRRRGRARPRLLARAPGSSVRCARASSGRPARAWRRSPTPRASASRRIARRLATLVESHPARARESRSSGTRSGAWSRAGTCRRWAATRASRGRSRSRARSAASTSRRYFVGNDLHEQSALLARLRERRPRLRRAPHVDRRRGGHAGRRRRDGVPRRTARSSCCRSAGTTRCSSASARRRSSSTGVKTRTALSARLPR